MAKILIIDDDAEVRRYLQRVIELAGHEAMMAEEGAEGLRLAADPGIQLILTDLNMPGEVSEMELIRQLKALRPECPIVVCSGYPTQERLDECETLGIRDFLTKPFEVSFARAVLDRFLTESDEAQTTHGES